MLREINLEVKYDGTFRRTPYLRQGETGTSTLYLTLPTEFQGYKYVLVFQPVTGDPISTEELTPDENQIISYVLTAVFTAEVGTIGVELNCYDESDNLVKSAEMSIEVKESLSGAGDVIPTDYVPWYVLAAQKASEAEEDAEYIAGILPVLEPQISAATTINNTLINTTIPAATVINGTLTDTIIPAAEAAEESLQALIDSTPTIQEIIDARNGEDTLGDRLTGFDTQLAETTQQINDLNALKAITQNDGSILNVNINEVINGKYVITATGLANDYSVIKLNNNKYATRIYDTYNEWSKALGKGLFVAHKGLNGWQSGSSVAGVYPENSLKAFEKAGELGYKMIEADVSVTSDGHWIVNHELDTKNLSGTLANINTITLDDFKSRTLVQQYVGGSYWTYTGENTGYIAPTMEEMLLVCKKYNTYALVDIKWADPYYSEQNFIDFAEIVKKIGMEEKVIVYGSRPTMSSVMKYLPNAIAGFTDILDDSYLALVKSYKNHFISTDYADYETLKTTIKDNKIPCAVWTYDDYKTAETIFENGADYILTNTLIKQANLDRLVNYINYNSNGIVDFPDNNVGTLTIDAITNELNFVTATYYSKRLTIPASDLKLGDVIRIRATGQTLSSTTGNFGRVVITNAKAGTLQREQTAFFYEKTYKTKEIYYIINDVSENIYIHIGLAGAGFSGSAEAKFKDITIDIFSPMSNIERDNERFGYIYSITAPFALRVGYASRGIKNITASGAVLSVEYEPFGKPNGYPAVIANTVYYSTKYHRKVLPDIMNTDLTNHIVKLRFYESDGTAITDVTGIMEMGFVIQIKN